MSTTLSVRIDIDTQKRLEALAKAHQRTLQENDRSCDCGRELGEEIAG